MNVQKGGLACGVAVALFAAGVAMAQDRTTERRTETRTTQTTSAIRVSSVMKSKVLLKDEQAAGTIVDFVISDHGCIEYLIAEDDSGFYAIPFSAARVDFQEHTVVLSVTRTEFRDVVRFRSNEWSNFSDNAFQQRLFKFWGVKGPRVGTFEENRTARPIRDGRDDDRDDRRPDARDPKTPRDGDRTPETRDPKNPRNEDRKPEPRDPKSPRNDDDKPDAKDPKPQPRPPERPKAEPKEPTPRPNPGAETPKPRPETPRPKTNPPAGTPQPKTPRNERP